MNDHLYTFYDLLDQKVYSEKALQVGFPWTFSIVLEPRYLTDEVELELMFWLIDNKWSGVDELAIVRGQEEVDTGPEIVVVGAEKIEVILVENSNTSALMITFLIYGCVAIVILILGTCLVLKIMRSN